MGLDGTAAGEGGLCDVTVTLVRVGPPKKDSYRTLYFTINGSTQEVEATAYGASSAVICVVLTCCLCCDHRVGQVEVQDAEGDVSFSGPMADKSDASQVASPMPGAVDKVRSLDVTLRT